jgi:hypothetical protein
MIDLDFDFKERYFLVWSDLTVIILSSEMKRSLSKYLKAIIYSKVNDSPNLLIEIL